MENIPKIANNVLEVFGGRIKFAGRVTGENRDINKINYWAKFKGKNKLAKAGSCGKMELILLCM